MYLPGLTESGMKTEPTSPRLHQASTRKLAHPNTQHIVHTHPGHPSTCVVDTFVYIPSMIIPTPIMRKKPVTHQKSTPLAIAHMPKSCSTPETKKAARTPPIGPTRNFIGLAPTAMKQLLNNWCQRLDQKSVNDAEAQGELNK